MHNVVALALPGVVMFDLAVPFEVFGNEELEGRYSYEVCTVTPGGVLTSDGLTLAADRGLEALRRADTVVVPGYSPLGDPPLEALIALREAAARGARVVSLCTGAFALGAAGLLDGRR